MLRDPAGHGRREDRWTVIEEVFSGHQENGRGMKQELDYILKVSK